MKKYLIGNLITEIDINCNRLERLGKPYETAINRKADISFKLSDSDLEKLHIKNPQLTRDELAFLASGTLFFKKVSPFDALMLHSSCIMYEGKAYLFTAHSGTGKSTHTALWKNMFGDKVTYINDDKPLLRKINGVWTAFGNPWSGKTDLNTNISAPVGAIVFLNRGEENKIRKLIPPEDVVAPRFIEQTAKPYTPERTIAMLNLADDLLTSVDLFELHCNISEDAVLTTYNAIVK